MPGAPGASGPVAHGPITLFSIIGGVWEFQELETSEQQLQQEPRCNHQQHELHWNQHGH